MVNWIQKCCNSHILPLYFIFFYGLALSCVASGLTDANPGSKNETVPERGCEITGGFPSQRVKPRRCVFWRDGNSISFGSINGLLLRERGEEKLTGQRGQFFQYSDVYTLTPELPTFLLPPGRDRNRSWKFLFPGHEEKVMKKRGSVRKARKNTQMGML